MKNRKAYTIAALTGVGLLLSASLASAAVSRILCVPWQGNPNAPHTAISGQAVKLTAVIYGDATGGSVSYSWDFQDGTAPASGTIAVPANGVYNLEVTHTYSAAVNTPFTTTLSMDGKSDTYKILIAPDNNDSKTNIAIDKALWYLHKDMVRTTAGSPAVPAGYWNDYSYYVGRSGAPVWAFEVQGHLLSVEANPLQPLEDPYVDDVQRGINYILSRTYAQSMNAQTHGHPEDYDGDGDGDEGNGYGLVAYYDSGHTNYEQGLAMGAIAGSGAPDAVAATGQATYVLGRTYRDIVQDMADWYGWSQIDGTAFPPSGALGGWYYTAANNTGWNPNYGDNSASQWAYIGLEAAQNNFGAAIPTWVKTRLAGYLHNQIAYNNRGFVSYRSGYSWYSDFTTPNVCLTGGALVGMKLVGQSLYDAQNGAGSYSTDLNLATTFLGNNWLGQANRWTENWYGHRAYYTMYAIMKGLRLHSLDSLPGTPGTADWYGDYVGVMLPDQYADGHWRGTGWMDGYIVNDMGTAFGVLILTPSVFSPPPVACFNANPNPGYMDVPISFDPSCSYHSDGTKSIVLYEWDFDNDGVYDVTSTTPDVQTFTWDDATYDLGTYPVTLRVTDDSDDPVTDTATIDVNLTLPPHPPVADAGGPYMTTQCGADSLTLDGSGSFDIDEGTSESGNPPFDTITDWAWDLDNAPWDYVNESGESVALSAADIATYFTLGEKQIGLKVTDNTAAAYPGSQQPDLTGEGFDTVTVYDDCLCTLSARAKLNKVQLVWANTGAASYDIYRSTIGPNSGFSLIKDNLVTSYATYLDSGLTIGTPYWYRVVDSNGCGSVAVKVVPTTR
ncbi:MAG: PKD domain-containing protein [Thermodesulfobacteriota bacterium]